jgi:hypothetical protein
MTPARPTLLMIACLMPGLAVLGCVDDDGDSASTHENQGGGGQGGNGQGGNGTGGDGGQSADACGCAAEEQCITCNTAGPPITNCVATKSPSANELACKWTACAVGDICLDIQPAGDGCPDAQCAAVPAECASDPTCPCLSDAFTGVLSCSDDGTGNITVTKYPF